MSREGTGKTSKWSKGPMKPNPEPMFPSVAKEDETDVMMSEPKRTSRTELPKKTKKYKSINEIVEWMVSSDKLRPLYLTGLMAFG